MLLVFQVWIDANPMRSPGISDFLERERQALARRRQIFGLSSSSTTDTKCQNMTFDSVSELLDAGFELDQCITDENCQQDCKCQIVEDEVCDQGQSCTKQICEQIEEVVCDGPLQTTADIPQQVCMDFSTGYCTSPWTL